MFEFILVHRVHPRHVDPYKCQAKLSNDSTTAHGWTLKLASVVNAMTGQTYRRLDTLSILRDSCWTEPSNKARFNRIHRLKFTQTAQDSNQHGNSRSSIRDARRKLFKSSEKFAITVQYACNHFGKCFSRNFRISECHSKRLRRS